jgi:hypothetical protein
MTQETKMRRSLAILFAAATAVTAAATSFTSAQAAPVSPTLLAATALQSDGVEQVRHKRGHDRWRHDDRWRHRDRGRRHHRHHGANVFPGFHFGFPFAYAPRAYYPRPYQPYARYGDCFRTWDGQLICR